MKLTKEEKQELKGYIKFDDGIITNQDQLEKKIIDFINKKYRTKYKQNDDKYEYIISKLPPDSDGEVKRLVMEDNEFIERTSVLLYQQSIKDRRERGVKVKNDSYNIEPVASGDIGIKRQYLPYYQLNSEKIYLTFESINNYSEESKTQWACEQVYAKAYSEKEKTIDNAINSIFDKYRDSENKNEILFLLLINLNKYQLDWYSREALTFFLNQELRNYKILPKQQQVLDHIILAGKIPNANKKKSLKRMLRINDK